MVHYVEGVNARLNGANMDFYFGDTVVFKIRVSDNQLLLDSGVEDDNF